MPAANMARIIAHWTAGTYTPSGLDLAHYHILVKSDGSIVRGQRSIKDNESTADGVYARHTKGTNKGSIGITVCCMRGANESPFSAGASPMLKVQWLALADVAARLCKRYDIAVTPQTVLGHGEVEANIGNPQDGKWDPMKLPWDPGVSSATVGNRFRANVSAVLATL
jgi:N-acetyl-anhydromuramyl-L-alanine amidase AmpD